MGIWSQYKARIRDSESPTGSAGGISTARAAAGGNAGFAPLGKPIPAARSRRSSAVSTTCVCVCVGGASPRNPADVSRSSLTVIPMLSGLSASGLSSRRSTSISAARSHFVASPSRTVATSSAKRFRSAMTVPVPSPTVLATLLIPCFDASKKRARRAFSGWFFMTS